MPYSHSNYEATSAKITIGGQTFKGLAAINERDDNGMFDIALDGAGSAFKRRNRLTHTITFQPDGRCTATILGILFAGAQVTPGGLLSTGSCIIHTEDGRKRTYGKAWIRPNFTVNLSTRGVMFPTITIIATKPDAATVLYTDASVDYDGITFDDSEILLPSMTCAWGSVTGFTEFFGQNGITLNYNARTEEVLDDRVGLVADRVLGWDISASMVPIGPTMAQLQTALGAASAAMGAAPGSKADLTLSATGLWIKLTNAVITGTPARTFSAAAQVMGEVTWSATPKYSSGWIKPLVIADAEPV